jgi:pyruvate dehydrogenase E2 component (dihydrolipoamide acetyltransferase)
MNAPNFTVAPLSPIRKAIAARMMEATRTIPHFRLVLDIEMDALLALREEFNVAHPNAKISINACLVKACASALIEQPAVNIQLIAEELRHYRQADISVVVAVTGGLATPIIRDANTKTVHQIAAEVKELSVRAATGRLKRSEIEGGTFSISNLGMYGVDQFDAIINPPQCAILAIGRTRPRMLVCDTRSGVAQVLRATLSVDHRAIDGVTAAAFVKTLRQILERPRVLFGV